MAAIVRLLGDRARLVHTGQHEDPELAGVFFASARLPVPDKLTGVRGLPRFQQLSQMIGQLGELLSSRRPAAVLVQGDTNTASAAAQAANYAGVPVVHVEAGLRSFDRAMPEEINRCLVGVLADLHCAPTPTAVRQLAAEGVPASRIELTGNTIVEATLETLPSPAAAAAIAASHGVEPDRYVLATIHRPENTDDRDRLEAVLTELGKLGLPVVLPLHPRTRLAAERYGLTAALDRLLAVPPVDHPTFLGLARLARLLVSDSGGVQEECTVLKKPLVVVRNSTERPESIEAGFAHLVPPGAAVGEVGRRLIGDDSLAERLAGIPCPFGDGTASARIAAAALRYLV
jgi:UDP-N-acetylglucosamine 2-epimerase (non-hydrolysing)